MNNERQLINYLRENICPQGRFERSQDKDKRNYHVTVKDADSDTVYESLIAKGYQLTDSDRHHSSAYVGKKLIFNGNEVYLVVRDKNSNGTHYMKRKEVTPDRIGLGGKTFDNALQMREEIYNGLSSCTSVDNTVALMSILDVVDGLGKFKNTHILSADKSRITSDFGEVVSAYIRVTKGQKVFFPKESNHPSVDFFADGVGVSAKGDKGSSRLSIIDYADSIQTLGNSNVAQVLKYLCDRKIYDVLNVAADACDELQFFKNKLRTITMESMKKYVNDVNYDTYVKDIITAQKGGIIGLPKKETECRNYWSKGDVNPLLFTLCTFLHRFYSQQNIDKLSELVVKLFTDTNIEFEYFDYDINAESISIDILPISQYKVWEINYWGNAASALNNWPAVKGLQ
jgi:hypothetical protein